MIYLRLQGEAVCWVKCSQTGMGIWGSSPLQPTPQTHSPSLRPLSLNDVKKELERPPLFFLKCTKETTVIKAFSKELGFIPQANGMTGSWELAHTVLPSSELLSSGGFEFVISAFPEKRVNKPCCKIVRYHWGPCTHPFMKSHRRIILSEC